MPYINEDTRQALAAGAPAVNPGELNYVLTRLAQEYVQVKGLTYGTLNDVMGVFSSATAEFYRRIVVPFEERKCSINGDVYDIAITHPEMSKLEKPILSKKEDNIYAW